MDNIKKGIYRHFKGHKYLVLSEGRDSENQEEVVIYQDIESKKVWCRPKEMFLETVEVEGEEKPRFEFIQEEEDFESKYLRALADYQNLSKQSQKDKEDFAKFALSGFLMDLLPIYDHLKLSLNGLSEEEKNNAWAIGVSHVLKQFKDLLNSRQVEEIETEGKEFDHNTMEAIDGEGDMVKKEIMPGYTLNGRVIRPAKVMVESVDKKEKK